MHVYFDKFLPFTVFRIPIQESIYMCNPACMSNSPFLDIRFSKIIFLRLYTLAKITSAAENKIPRLFYVLGKVKSYHLGYQTLVANKWATDEAGI